MPITISKSKYMAGVQCLKRLYLLVHEPQIGGGKTAADFALMDQGRQVGKLAHQLFPGGVEVRAGDPEEAIRTTRELVSNPEVSAIFEGAFEHGGVLVRVDVLQRRRDGKWRLVEVKSSASLKDEHLEDVAIQYRVVSRSGLDLASACLAHVNRNYVYTGGNIDVWRFFRIKNLTRRVERLLPKLTFQLRSELRVLAMPNPPEIPTGPHCTNPVTCEFFDRCNPPLPNDHIGYLPRLHASAAEELEEMGVESISDIPDDFPLSERQRRACTGVQTGNPWFSAELGKDLESLNTRCTSWTLRASIQRSQGLRECVRSINSRFSGQSTYKRPRYEPEHYEFLATDSNDPRREFITSLCVHSGKAAASLSTPRLNRRGSRNSRRGCPSSRNRSRKFNVVSGICSPSSETTSTIPSSRGRTP